MAVDMRIMPLIIATQEKTRRTIFTGSLIKSVVPTKDPKKVAAISTGTHDQ